MPSVPRMCKCGHRVAVLLSIWGLSGFGLGILYCRAATYRSPKQTARRYLLHPSINSSPLPNLTHVPNKKPSKIVVCFPYNGEKRLVLDRLNTSSISYLVVSESTFSANGNPKHLRWEQDLRQMLTTFPIPVTYIVESRKLYDFKDNEGRWKQEVAVRSILGTGVRSLYESQLINDNDVIVVNDADEIVNDASLSYIRDNIKHGEYAEVSLSWFLYTRCFLHSRPWVQPVAVTVKTLRQSMNWNPHLIRAIHNPSVNRNTWRKMSIPLKNNGYHCSWCLSKQDIRTKFEMTCCDIPESVTQQRYSDDRIQNMRLNGINWNGQVHGQNVCSNGELKRELIRFDDFQLTHTKKE